MRAIFVVNPIAGGKDKRYFVKNIEDYCYSYGVDYKIFYTTGKFDAELLADEVDVYKPERALSIGGDGTFRLLCSVVKGKNIPVGYVPFGSANGMNYDLIPAETPWECFESIMASFYTKDMDIIEINGHDCIHVSDIGVNAQLVKAYAQDGTHGMMGYAKNFLRAISSQETYTFIIKVGSETYEKKGAMLMIANGTRYGSGLVFNKAGSPFDGYFDIIVLRQVNLKMILRAALRGFEGEIRSGNYYYFHAREADIKISRETTLQIDGEVAGRYSKLKIKSGPLTVPVILLRPPEERTAD